MENKKKDVVEETNKDKINKDKKRKKDRNKPKEKKRYLKHKKSSDKEKKPPLIERFRLSLALKLSMKTFWRSVAVFLSFNIFVMILVVCIFIFSVTSGLNDTKIQIDKISSKNITIVDDAFVYDNDSDDINAVIINPHIKLIPKDEMPESYNLGSWKSIAGSRGIPHFFEEYYFNLYTKKSESFFFSIIPPRINVSEYGAYTVLENGDYLLYSLMPFVNVVSVFFVVIIIFEFFSTMNGLFVMSKRIKKTLKPIQMLAESVHSINGYDMDARLYISGTQNELVDLVAEINGLLDRIQDAYSAQNRFVSDASHELRTPIAVIQGYANLLNRWGKQDEQTLNEGILAIQNETKNMKNLVEQLLFLARSDHKTTKLEMTSFELTMLVDEVYNETKMVDADHEYSINISDMVWVMGDINMIKQLIRIFCENARKYTPKQGSIKFEVYHEVGFAILIIQDDGIGIAQEDIEHVFERFYRVDKSRARKEGGSGLGLAIADQIIRFHKGSVDVVSREGFGTRIIVRLPLSQPPIIPEDPVIVK